MKIEQVEPTQADKALTEAKSASDKTFADEMDALAAKHRQPSRNIEPEPEADPATKVTPESDDSPAEPEVKPEATPEVVPAVETEEPTPSVSTEEPKKGTSEYRIKQLLAKEKEAIDKAAKLEAKVKEYETRAPVAASPIQLMPQDPGEFKLTLMTPEQAEGYTNAQLFLWHNDAKEQGNAELAQTYLNAISEKEQYEKHKLKRKNYQDQMSVIGSRRNESILRTKKDFPDMYNENSSMFSEYSRLRNDPDFGEIINLIAQHPNAPYALAKTVDALMKSAKGLSADTLDKRVKELEAELATTKKAKNPPRSNSTGQFVPASENGKLSNEQQYEKDFADLIAKRGRKIA